jgi:hypothetical protein
VLEKERMHVESKNIKMDAIVMKDGRNYNSKMSWEDGVQYAQEIEKLSEEEVFGLKLKYPAPGKETIGDEWRNALKQTKDNQEWISQKIGSRVDSFCVLSLGWIVSIDICENISVMDVGF